ncbi:hypothetical protein HRbin36_02091 [bacterium HR36]|nr:hypothetical protein HRbin36_02091 [bacterium HR36]
MYAELALQFLHDVPEIRPDTVELVDESQARHPMPIRLTPDGLALHFHSPHCTENTHRAVQHAERALDLCGEIHVPWRINNGKAVPAPEERHRGALDGNPLFAFQRIVVGGGGSFVHITSAMFGAADEQ